ncbi:MAG: alanine:cation symporter family protein [Acidobacteriota bacterium]
MVSGRRSLDVGSRHCGDGYKILSCTLVIMYRGRDSLGHVQGGPMYYIEVGLGPKFRFLAIFFSICGMIGCLSMFQVNQWAEILWRRYADRHRRQQDRCLSCASFTCLAP